MDARPSATASGTIWASISLNFLRSWTSFVNSLVASSPVCASRYFSTNDVTPFDASQLATSMPSLLIESAMNPPPGQITTDVPVAWPGWGLYTVRVGWVTLVTTSVCQTLEKYSFSG